MNHKSPPAPIQDALDWPDLSADQWAAVLAFARLVHACGRKSWDLALRLRKGLAEHGWSAVPRNGYGRGARQ